MWTQSTMSFPESIVMSALGLSVVFITLIVLALAIVIISTVSYTHLTLPTICSV